MMRRIWNRKPKTKEELEEERKNIVEQQKLFELEIAIQEEAISFRELYLQWLDEVITLDEIFEKIAKNSLCHKISVWTKK